jgi:NADPH:quinone reductase-like Zn-dependent oxidoreductase
MKQPQFQDRPTVITMKVMRFNDSYNAPALIAGTAPVPQPQPGRGEILIRVHASGVTPTELRWYPTTHTPDGGRRSSAIPGHEFSDVVEAVAADVDPNQIGSLSCCPGLFVGVGSPFLDRRGRTRRCTMPTHTSISRPATTASSRVRAVVYFWPRHKEATE